MTTTMGAPALSLSLSAPAVGVGCEIEQQTGQVSQSTARATEVRDG